MITKPNISFENIQVAFASKTDAELQKMYFIFSLMHRKIWIKAGMKLAELAFALGLPVKGLVKKTMFNHFCGGENIKDCSATVQELGQYDIGAILDYSVEGKQGEAGFDQAKEEILKTIVHARLNPNLHFTVFKISGIGDSRILTKVQKGEKLSGQEKTAYRHIEERVDCLCKAAHDAKVSIMIDAEETWFQDVVDDLAQRAMQKYNTESAIVYNTYQMYRRDMLRKLKDAHHHAVANNYYLGVKLVRGAYMEKERKRAAEKNYPDPIQPTKEATDKDYDEALQFCINNKQRVFLVNGSHNELSNLVLTELMYLHGIKPSDKRFYFAQLYGMSDNISFNLAKNGYNVLKYVPYGPVKEVLPYLYRRAMENSSIAGQSSREFQLVQREITRRKKENR